MKKNMVKENFCRPTFLSSVLCSNDFQTNKKSIELDAENTKHWPQHFCRCRHLKMLHIPSIFTVCAAKLVKYKMIYRPVNLSSGQKPPVRRQMLAEEGEKKMALMTVFVAGTSAAAEWCKENLRWAAAAAAPGLEFRGPGLDLAAAAAPVGSRLQAPAQANYQPAQILQFQMSTQS